MLASGVVLLLAGITGTILAVVLGLAAVAVYFLGAKSRKPWGVPLLIFCVAGAVVAMVLGIWGGPSGAEIARTKVQEQVLQRARLCGKGLSEKIRDGAKVVVLRPVLEGEDPMNPTFESLPPLKEREQKICAAIKEAIQEGAGKKVELIGCEAVMSSQLGPEALESAEFAAILQTYEDRAPAAWISLVGIPPEREGGLAAVGTHEWSRPPRVAADVDIFYDPEVLRDYFGRGLLTAVVLIPPAAQEGPVVIATADELPAKAFRE